MKCKAPINIIDGHGYNVFARCGQCLPCRIRRQSGWALRNQLELQMHCDAAFLTLTYKPEVCPETLDYTDFQLFLKRLRKQQGPIRFFCVGEYGTKTGRPHWHAIIYGMPGQKKAHWRTRLWPHGFAYIGTVTTASIAYVARYCLKFGEKGEEALMRSSLKPPVGSNVIYQLGRRTAINGKALDMCPTCIEYNGKIWPLDGTMQDYFTAGYNELGGELAKPALLIKEVEYVLENTEGDPIIRQKAAQSTKIEYLTRGKATHGTF